MLYFEDRPFIFSAPSHLANLSHSIPKQVRSLSQGHVEYNEIKIQIFVSWRRLPLLSGCLLGFSGKDSTSVRCNGAP